MCPDDPQYWPQRDPDPSSQPKPESKWLANLKRFGGPVAIALIAGWKYVGIAAKAVLPAIKFLKLGKVLTTMGSMVLSVWFYQLMFGWKFSVGFVILILVHEMGHVYVAWRQGVPVTAPLFIPGMGALILQKREAESAWGEALIGIGGPVAGSIGAAICYGIFLATREPLFLGLAYTGFFLNLFNLAPIFPLDGGWIVGSISPYLWVVGLILMVAAAVTGYLRNPMIYILVLLALPRIWAGIRHGRPMGSESLRPSTPQQKWTMGLAYVGLIAVLAFAMGETHIDQPHQREKKTAIPAMRLESNSSASNS